MSDGWFALLGAAVGGGFALINQQLARRQERDRWKTEESRLKVEQRLRALTELAEAVNGCVLAVNFDEAERHSEEEQAYFKSQAAKLLAAQVKASVYLEPVNDRRVSKLYSAYLDVIEALFKPEMDMKLVESLEAARVLVVEDLRRLLSP